MMKCLYLCALVLASASGMADDPGPVDGSRAVAAAAAAPAPTARPRGVAPGLAAAATGAPVEARPAQFATEEKWGMAGYNSNEPVYTILVTSQDERVIRCTVDLKGTYIENGEKLGISDRQTTTVFPNQQVPIGNWSGMDQQSGATYSVKCRPV